MQKQTSPYEHFQNYEEDDFIQHIRDYCNMPYLTDLKGISHLKFTIRHIERSHDGYCSGYGFGDGNDDINDADSEIKIITLCVPIPQYLTDNKGKLKVSVDNNFNLNNNDDTEKLFEEWTGSSNCEGSGYCGLYDTYIPIKIQYISS
jgi:hypothetical protein